MIDMPFHLKTLPLEALDILRYYSKSLGSGVADSDAIMEATGLSERGFSKGIKRLVTKGYMVMDGGRSYSLSDQGRRSVAELLEYDASAALMPQDVRPPSRIVERRLVLALPRRPLGGQPINVYVGFHEADDDAVVAAPINLLVRLSILNGEPARPKESPFLLDNNSARQVFEVTPGTTTRARLKVHVYQTDDLDEAALAGGMYVDFDLTSDPTQADSTLTAYGAPASFTAG